MVSLAHRSAVTRTISLLEGKQDTKRQPRPGVRPSSPLPGAAHRLSKLLVLADIRVHPIVFSGLCVCCGCGLSFLLHQFLAIWLLPLTFVTGATLPIGLADSRAEKRSLDFAEDFPAILLATASSLSAGHTALSAVEKSVRLLPPGSHLRHEVRRMLERLHNGESRDRAIRQFGLSIRLPELTLFRAAFLLSLESGGKFAPTLHRLAQVMKDRIVLIRSARTATSVMRMTANILIGLAPLIIGLVASRTPSFLDLLRENVVANTVGSIGFALIGCNYLVLRRMSEFRP